MTMTNRPRKMAPAIPPMSVTVDLLLGCCRGGGRSGLLGLMFWPGMWDGRGRCFPVELFWGVCCIDGAFGGWVGRFPPELHRDCEQQQVRVDRPWWLESCRGNNDNRNIFTLTLTSHGKCSLTYKTCFILHMKYPLYYSYL